jgi:hypothetical protein
MSRNTQTGVAIAALFIMSSLGTAAVADQFQLDWWSVDAGGSFFTTGDAYELSGTIAQPDVGATMTGGDYELESGVWSPVNDGSACAGDIDGDGDTDHADLGALLAAWDSQPGDPTWNENADLDGDGHVSHADLGILLADWGCGT